MFAGGEHVPNPAPAAGEIVTGRGAGEAALGRGEFIGPAVWGRFGSVCRLFGLTAGEERVGATFWLLDAPDSLREQSHRNVDGAGLGYFGPDGGVVRPDLGVESWIAVPEPPAHLVPLPPGNPNIDT